jgi:uncharacterized membrane protein YkvA (DUF1232 family)
VLARLKGWASTVKRDAIALFLAARDPRTPWCAKVMAGLVAAYALSPIDLVPDFIPVLGYLDDLVIVPLGIWIAVSLMPSRLMQEFRAEAARMEAGPVSRTGAVSIVVLWIVSASLLLWWFWPRPANWF